MMEKILRKNLIYKHIMELVTDILGTPVGKEVLNKILKINDDNVFIKVVYK